MAGVEIFTKVRFEGALTTSRFAFRPLGQVRGQEEYLVDFGNPHAFIRVCSSIGPNGLSRECAEDSIRTWLVDPAGMPLGKTKISKYTTRRPGWDRRLAVLLAQLAKLGRHVQPCKVCGKLLLLAVKNDRAYLFCPEDSANRNNPDHHRHFQLLTLDLNGDEVKPEKPQTCHVCNTPLIKVIINRGSNTGKHALTCPKKEGGKFLNHVFQVLS